MGQLLRSNLEFLLEKLVQDGMVCPKPQAWDKLWNIIKASVGDEPLALPLILAAGGETTDHQKLDRFLEQLAVGERNGAGSRLFEEISGLSPSRWHYGASSAAGPLGHSITCVKPTAIEPDLVHAYLQTDFVLAGETELVFNVGRASPGLDVAMIWRGRHQAVFLTAHNPFSKDVGAEQNGKAQTALLDDMRRSGLDWIAREGRDPMGDWPGEPSVLILGTAWQQALDLGHASEQNAVVWCAVGRPPELVLLR